MNRRIDVAVTLSRRNLRALLLTLGDEDTPSTFAREVEPGVRLVAHPRCVGANQPDA